MKKVERRRKGRHHRNAPKQDHQPIKKESSKFADAKQAHDRGTNGDKPAVKKSYQLFTELAKEQPNNPEVKAYLGSATALLGRDAASVTDKMKYAMEGLSLLDAVVDKNPTLIIGRILRGNVSYRLPELYFQRTATAIEDFSYLVDAYEKDETILSRDELAEITSNLIKALERNNQGEKAQKYKEKRKRKQIKPVSSEKGVAEPTDEVYKTSNDELVVMSEEAYAMHQKALNGGLQEVKEAIQYFERLNTYDASPEVQMYVLDVQSMLGRESLSTYEMFGSAIKAMKAMDQLIQEHPDNTEIRLIRARQSLRLPEVFFRRSATAISDLQFVLDKAKSEKLPAADIDQIYFELATAYEKMDLVDEASKVWAMIIRRNPSSSLRAKVRNKQKVYGIQKETGHLQVRKKDRFYKTAEALHYVGVRGNKQAAEKSLQLWEQAKEEYPDCVTATLFHAASLALKGRHATEPEDMFKHTIQALKILKELELEDPKLIYIRATIYFELPQGFFFCTDKAIKDFQRVIECYEEADVPPLPKEEYLLALYKLGILNSRMSLLDQAKKVWTKLKEQDTEGHYTKLLEMRGVS